MTLRVQGTLLVDATGQQERVGVGFGVEVLEGHEGRQLLALFGAGEGRGGLAHHTVEVDVEAVTEVLPDRRERDLELEARALGVRLHDQGRVPSRHHEVAPLALRLVRRMLEPPRERHDREHGDGQSLLDEAGPQLLDQLLVLGRGLGGLLRQEHQVVCHGDVPGATEGFGLLGAGQDAQLACAITLEAHVEHVDLGGARERRQFGLRHPAVLVVEHRDGALEGRPDLLVLGAELLRLLVGQPLTRGRRVAFGDLPVPGVGEVLPRLAERDQLDHDHQGLLGLLTLLGEQDRARLRDLAVRLAHARARDLRVRSFLGGRHHQHHGVVDTRRLGAVVAEPALRVEVTDIHGRRGHEPTGQAIEQGADLDGAREEHGLGEAEVQDLARGVALGPLGLEAGLLRLGGRRGAGLGLRGGGQGQSVAVDAGAHELGAQAADLLLGLDDGLGHLGRVVDLGAVVAVVLHDGLDDSVVGVGVGLVGQRDLHDLDRDRLLDPGVDDAFEPRFYHLLGRLQTGLLEQDDRLGTDTDLRVTQLRVHGTLLRKIRTFEN